jgi:hypothetical protein
MQLRRNVWVIDDTQRGLCYFQKNVNQINSSVKEHTLCHSIELFPRTNTLFCHRGLSSFYGIELSLFFLFVTV